MVQTTHEKTVDRDGASPAVAPDADAIARLADRYTFRDPEEVTRYLQRYPHIVPHLHEIADRVPHYFGAERPLALEMFFDPEYADHEGELFVNVLVPSDDDDALDQLNRLGDDWWYLAAPPLPGTVVIDIEPA